MKKAKGDMGGSGTITELFEVAISAENAGQEFYRGLALKFSHMSNVSDFWKGMMDDEIGHAEELKSIRSTLTPEQLQAPADPEVFQRLREIFGTSLDVFLGSIKSLDDAYNKAHELENSEVNRVFRFLANKFVDPEKKDEFIRETMVVHLKKLMMFPEIFGEAERRKKITIRGL